MSDGFRSVKLGLRVSSNSVGDQPQHDLIRPLGSAAALAIQNAPRGSESPGKLRSGMQAQFQHRSPLNPSKEDSGQISSSGVHQNNGGHPPRDCKSLISLSDSGIGAFLRFDLRRQVSSACQAGENNILH